MTAIEMGRELPAPERAQAAFPFGVAKITVCSWCQSVVRVEPDKDRDRKQTWVTHGICSCCHIKVVAEFAQEVAA